MQLKDDPIRQQRTHARHTQFLIYLYFYASSNILACIKGPACQPMDFLDFERSHGVNLGRLLPNLPSPVQIIVLKHMYEVIGHASSSVVTCTSSLLCIHFVIV